MYEARAGRQLHTILIAQMKRGEITGPQAETVSRVYATIANSLPALTHDRAPRKWRELSSGLPFETALDEFREFLAGAPATLQPDAWAPMRPRGRDGLGRGGGPFPLPPRPDSITVPGERQWPPVIFDDDDSDPFGGIVFQEIPRKRCRDSKCSLTIYTDDKQLEDKELRKLMDLAFDARTKEKNQYLKEAAKKMEAIVRKEKKLPAVNAHSTGNIADTKQLGHHGVQEGQLLAFIEGKVHTIVKKANTTAFMAVLTYDCECPKKVELSAQKLNNGKWGPDPPRSKADKRKPLLEKITVDSPENKNQKGKKGGQCKKAFVDTPGRINGLPKGIIDKDPERAKKLAKKYRTLFERGHRDPEPVSGSWRVVAKVTWENGNVCERTVQLDIKQGIPQVPILVKPIPVKR